MKRRTMALSNVAFVAAMGMVLGCQFITAVDRRKIKYDDAASGGGGAGGAGGLGGAGGAGGLGGGGNGGAGGASGSGGQAPIAPGDPLWGDSLGDIGDERIHAVAADGQGGFVLAGGFRTLLRFGDGSGDVLVSAGGDDVVVAKLDEGFGHVWSKSFGDGLDQAASAIAVDGRGNIVVAGGFLGTINFSNDPGAALVSAGGRDLFVAKLDAEGNHLWSRRFGDELDQAATAVAVGAAGEIVVIGTFDGTINFSGDPGDTLTSIGLTNAVLAKLDEGGDHLFSQPVGGVDSWQSFRSVALSATDIYLGATFAGILDLDGISVASAIEGFTDQGEAIHGADGLVARVDLETGATVWARAIGAAGEQYAKLIAISGNGDPTVIGNTIAPFTLGSTRIEHGASAGYNLYAARFDAATGEPVAARGFSAPGDQFVFGWSAEPSGNYVLGGSFTTALQLGGELVPVASPSGSDAFVAKLGPDFSEIWSTVLRDSSYSYITAQAVRGDGAVFAAGSFYGNELSLGDGLPAVQHSPQGMAGENGDIFLVGLAP